MTTLPSQLQDRMNKAPSSVFCLRGHISLIICQDARLMHSSIEDDSVPS